MNCSNCHRDIPADVLLCPYCGHEQQAEILGVCQNCDRTIPDDAVFCPYCGHQVGRQSLQQAASSLSITSPRFLQIQALLFFVWCVICSCCAVSSFFFGSRGISTPRRLPTSTVTPQYTRQSPISIVTPEPTKAIAPPYTEIAGNLETMTEAQWNNYPITFSGKITAVTDILGVGLVIALEEAEWSTE